MAPFFLQVVDQHRHVFNGYPLVAGHNLIKCYSVNFYAPPHSITNNARHLINFFFEIPGIVDRRIESQKPFP